MKRLNTVMVLLLVLFSVMALCTAANAEISFTPIPEDDSLYLFWQPFQGEVPPAPQAEAALKKVTVTGLSPWGVREEDMQAYATDMAWGQIAVGTAPDNTVVFMGDPDEFDLSFDTEGYYSKIRLEINKDKDHPDRYNVTLVWEDKTGHWLRYYPETGTCTISYGGMIADYDAKGMLVNAEYNKESKKSNTYCVYKRINAELPVFRMVHAYYKDKKTVEEWDLYRPEKNTPNPKHISPDAPPFSIVGLDRAEEIMAERTANGLAWLSTAFEEAAYAIVLHPALPEYEYSIGGSTMTITLTGLEGWLIPDGEMRTWAYDPAGETWTPSGDLTPDMITFIVPWDEASAGRDDYMWEAGTYSTGEWNVIVQLSPWAAADGRTPWSIVLNNWTAGINYTFRDSGRYDKLAPYVSLIAGEKRIDMEYDPDGWLRCYSVYTRTNTEEEGMYYTYEYSSLSGCYILKFIDHRKPGGEDEIVYRRDLNEYWHRSDLTGRETEETPCSVPEEARYCIPLPIR